MLKLTREAKVAILVLMAAGMVLFGLSYLQGKSIFSGTTSYHAVFENIEGLNRGDKVILNGKSVGVIRDHELGPGPKHLVTVYFDVNSDIQIPEDSYVVLGSSDLFGTMVLDISLGNSSTILGEDALVQDSVKASMLGEVQDKLDPTLQRINKLSDNLISITSSISKILKREDVEANKSIRQIEIALMNIAVISSKLKTTVDNINQLTKNADELVGDPNLKGTFANINNSTDSLQYTMAQLHDLTVKTNKLMNQLNGITTKMNSNEGSVGALLNDRSLYNNLDSTSASLNDLLIDLREHPGRYVHISVFGRKDKTKKKKKNR